MRLKIRRHLTLNSGLWSKDAENSALHQTNKLHFKIYSNKKMVIL